VPGGVPSVLPRLPSPRPRCYSFPSVTLRPSVSPILPPQPPPTPSRPPPPSPGTLACRTPPSLPGRIPATIPRRDCPPRLLSHGICLQCGIRARGRKKFQLFESGTKGAARKSGRDAWRRIACVAERYAARRVAAYVRTRGMIYDEHPCVAHYD